MPNDPTPTSQELDSCNDLSSSSLDSHCETNSVLAATVTINNPEEGLDLEAPDYEPPEPLQWPEVLEECPTLPDPPPCPEALEECPNLPHPQPCPEVPDGGPILPYPLPCTEVPEGGPTRPTTLDLSHSLKNHEEAKTLGQRRNSDQSEVKENGVESCPEAPQITEEKKALEGELHRCIEDFRKIRIPIDFPNKKRHWQSELLRKYQL